MRRRISLSVALVALLASHARDARGQAAVFDAANFGQNIITALRTAQNVVNTYEQIRLMEQQLANQIQNLRTVDATSFWGVNSLLNQTVMTFDTLHNAISSIGYSIRDVDRDFDRLFPTNPDRWRDVRYSDFNGYYGRWQSEITSSAKMAQRANTSIATLDQTNRRVIDILAQSQGASGEVRQLQLINQQLAIIHHDLAAMLQNLATLGRVTSTMSAAAAGEQMLSRESSRRRLEGYTNPGRPAKKLTRLP